MSGDKHIYKSHNKTALLYHIVCPVRYRKKAITEKVAITLKNTCIEMSKRYEIQFKGQTVNPRKIYISDWLCCINRKNALFKPNG